MASWPVLGLQPKGYVVATVHRVENADLPVRMATIEDALTATARHHLLMVWRLHPPQARRVTQNRQTRRSYCPGATDRPCGLPGHGAARKVRRLLHRRLRRCPKRGLILSGAVRHAARRGRVGGTRRFGLEPTYSTSNFNRFCGCCDCRTRKKWPAYCALRPGQYCAKNF